MAEPWRGPCGSPPGEASGLAEVPTSSGAARGGGNKSRSARGEVKTSPKPPPSAQNNGREDEEERKAPPATGTGLTKAAIAPPHPESKAPRWPTRPGPPSLPTGAPPRGIGPHAVRKKGFFFLIKSTNVGIFASPPLLGERQRRAVKAASSRDKRVRPPSKQIFANNAVVIFFLGGCFV